MADPTKLQQQTTDFTSAWDERKRTFDRLRDLRLNDEDREKAIADYVAAAKHFDELRRAVFKP